jgi:hypothetical protein
MTSFNDKSVRTQVSTRNLAADTKTRGFSAPDPTDEFEEQQS